MEQQSVFDFQLLPDGIILMILNSVFNIIQTETEDITQEYQYNLANIGSVRMLNLIVKASPIKVRMFDFMETPLWLRSIATMGILEGDDAFLLGWDSIIKEYHGQIIRERCYTSRVHDLLDITRSTEPVWIKAFARFLLINLITTESTVMDRHFLNGEMINIPVLTNDNIDESVKAIATVSLEDIKYWDVRNVTMMNDIFNNIPCAEHQLLDLLYWDTRNVINMSGLFANNTMDIIGITNWNICNVTTLSFMFMNNKYFNTPLNWNTSKVKIMDYMFQNAISFNQPLNWNTSKVDTMHRMFLNAISFNQPLIWDVSKVTDMAGMFSYATSFNQPLQWDVSKVTDMTTMFKNASSFRQELHWNIVHVPYKQNMFTGSFGKLSLR